MEQDCQKGSACNVYGNCETCSVGRYAPTDNLVQCKRCPVGKYGTDAVDSEDACKKCQTGRYADREGMSECEPCSRGFYQNKTGQPSCISAFSDEHTPMLCNETIYLKRGSVNYTEATRYYTDPHTCEDTSNKTFEVWEIILISIGAILLAIVVWLVCAIIQKACYC